MQYGWALNNDAMLSLCGVFLGGARDLRKRDYHHIFWTAYSVRSLYFNAVFSGR